MTNLEGKKRKNNELTYKKMKFTNEILLFFRMNKNIFIKKRRKVVLKNMKMRFKHFKVEEYFCNFESNLFSYIYIR